MSTSLPMSASDVAVIPSAVNGKLEKASLVEIKHGKIIFKQKSPSFDKMSETLQEIVRFREMIEQRLERHDPPLHAIPNEHKPVIAKLAHESDKSLTALAKYIHRELLPAQDEDEDALVSAASVAFPVLVVETAIKSVVNRTNYGLDAISGGSKLPASLSVWRWEVKEEYWDWLPKAAKEKAESRLAERLQAKKDLVAILQALPQEEREAILNPKATAKLSVTTKSNGKSVNQVKDGSDDVKPSVQSLKGKEKQEQKENNEAGENSAPQDCSAAILAPAPGRSRKVVDPEKDAKDKGKQERKVARAEKEKKEKEAQNKSRNLMVNFFGKAKSRELPPSTTDANAPAGRGQTEFEKAFKGFVLKKDAELAPVNWFMEARKMRGTGLEIRRDKQDIIVIDDEGDECNAIDVDVAVKGVDLDVRHMNERERLQSILASFPPCADPSRVSRRAKVPSSSCGLKTYHPLPVRTLLSQLSEAEISGDTSVVRKIIRTLSSRTYFSAKVLIFTEDARPGYFGTWTRSSRLVGPRTPFAKDMIALDYGYDSGEEWEEEDAGNADDVVEDGEDEEGGDGEDIDSDLDSWLVDDDEVVEVEDRREESPLPLPLLSPSIPTKRKADEVDKKLGKKRKVVIPLVPFAKGPCWEKRVGKCEYDPFKPYKIQLFNDAPCPIDPFTFVSGYGPEQCHPMTSVPPFDPVFSVPSLPAPTTNLAPITKRTSSAPKTSFPEIHLSFLLTKITSLATSNITFLVESIYQGLREHKVKKNAIEAKVREVGEKCKERKVWVVKGGSTNFAE